MRIDAIFQTFQQQQVAYLLIGGVNFLLRHAPVLTYDVDLWIEDGPENCARCEIALAEIQAEWGPDDSSWTPVAQMPVGWLRRQAVFCLTSPVGAIDIFRAVTGLPDWAACRARAIFARTAAGTAYWALADADMLRCQLALPPEQRNEARIQFLQNLPGSHEHDRPSS